MLLKQENLVTNNIVAVTNHGSELGSDNVNGHRKPKRWESISL